MKLYLLKITGKKLNKKSMVTFNFMLEHPYAKYKFGTFLVSLVLFSLKEAKRAKKLYEKHWCVDLEIVKLNINN